MDRAAKLEKYGGKRIRSRKRRVSRMISSQAFGWMGIAGIAVLAISLAAGLLFYLSFHKKEEEALLYVTKKELASCMSFLMEDALWKEWEQEEDDYVTRRQMKELTQKIGLAGMIVTTGGSDRLKREEVMNYYEQILDYLDLEKAVKKETILVLSSDGTSCQTSNGILYTQTGIPELKNFHTYGVYRNEQTILGIRAESEKTQVLRQAKVQAVSNDCVQAVYEKQEYEIPCKDQEGLKALKKAPDSSCTLCIKGGAITKIKNIEGSQPAKDNSEKTAAQKLPQTVKVLILNEGAAHYDQIFLACDGKWAVKKNEKKTIHNRSDIVSVKKLKLKKGASAVIESSDADGRLYLTDEDGNRISKGYFGRMTVYKDQEGYYLVNQVDIEKYLYSVVASEMPASFGVEALKAQAVCARSYVYRQIASDSLRNYHAQIDDSTNYQVYNKSDIVDADIQAVEDTAGEIMYAQDDIVNAYYFSASFGRTSNMEIWGQEEDDYPYLKIRSLNPKEKSDNRIDLSKEKDFRAYIQAQDTDVFDSDSRYYRWQAKVELSAKVKELKERIIKRQKISPDQFQFYITTKKKARKVSSLKGFGGVKKMSCSRRGKSGAVLVLTIQFEFGKVEIKSEYNIRSIIGCAMEQITYADGTTDTGSRFLPSAYFSIDFQKKSRRYVLTGGGNGHGMGMSQYGAAGMARAGWDYKKILTFFYDGIRIRNIRNE